MRNNELRSKYGFSHDPGYYWLDDAACRKSDPDLFSPVGNTGPALEQANRARKICIECPVIVQCLGLAVRQSVEVGVMGGMTEDERRSHKTELAIGKLGGQAITHEVVVAFSIEQLSNQKRNRKA